MYNFETTLVYLKMWLTYDTEPQSVTTRDTCKLFSLQLDITIQTFSITIFDIDLI